MAEESSKVEMVRSVKGKDMLLVGEYLFHYEDRSSKAYRWICSRRKDKTPCRVRIYTTLIDECDLTRHKVENIIGEHVHGPAEQESILRAREKKRQADAKGLPCTLGKKSQKWRLHRQELVKQLNAKKMKLGDDSEEFENKVKNDNELGDFVESLSIKTTKSPKEKKLLMLKTAKGHNMLAVDGCVYRLDGKSMLSTTYRWKCFRSKDLQCSGKIYTECLANRHHRFKPIHLEENIHNHQPYSDVKIEALIRRNSIKVTQGNEKSSFVKMEKDNKTTIPLSVTKSGGNVLSITTNIDLPRPNARRIRANVTSELYRQVDDVMDVLEHPKDGKITKFTFLPSLRKGNRILIMNNMIFHYNFSRPQSNMAYWTCLCRSDKVHKCKSRLMTEGLGKDVKIIKVSGEHDHKDNHREQILKRINQNLKTQKMEKSPMDREIDNDDDNDNEMGDHTDTPVDAINDIGFSRENSPDTGDFVELKEPKVEREIDIMEPTLTENSYASLVDCKNENEMDSCHETKPIIDDIKMEKLNTSKFHSDSEDELEYKPRATKSRGLTSAVNEEDDEDDEDYAPNTKGHVPQNNPDNIDITKTTKLRSARGYEQLCVDGYIYHLKNTFPPKRTYWACIKSKDRTLKCPARVTTVSNEENQLQVVNLSYSHNHPISENEIKKRLFYEFSKSAVNTKVKKKHIMEKSLSELNPEFAHLLGKDKTEKTEEVNPAPLDADPKPKTKRKRIKADDTITKLYRQVEDVMDVLENPKDGEITKFTFLPSLQGNRILIMNNMIYHHDCRGPKNDRRSYWTCLYRRNKEYKCNSRLISEGVGKDIKIIKVTGEHKHEGNHHEQILKRINQNLKPQKMEMFPMDSEKDDDDNNDNDIGGRNDTPEAAINDTGFSRENSSGMSDFTQLKEPKIKQEIDIMEPILNENVPASLVECKKESEMDPFHEPLPLIEHIKTERLNISNFGSDSEDEPEYKPRATKSRNIKSAANVGVDKDDEDYVPKSKGYISELNPKFAHLLGKHETVKMEEFKYSMKLYSASDSPPSLAVRMCLKALNISYELHNVDYIASEHLSEEYAKLNPQKEIPVLDDDGFYLSESGAIMQYLCDNYASDDNALYPKDPKERALVNHRLCFNMSFYYSSIDAYSMAPIFLDYERTEMGLKKVKNALSVFETYLESLGTKYATGNNVTIADFALVSATLCLEAIAFDLSSYPLITKWYNTFKKEHADLWSIANVVMQEIKEFKRHRPDLSHMNHPFHPTRKNIS